MKNFSSKKALFLSVISMVICVSMLIGSTFAWFTDSATASVNTIQAGNLDVELVKPEAKADGTYERLGSEALKWVAKDGRAQDKILWEPGCEYNLESFRIQNNGDLALKYKVVISGLTGNAKLLEAIDFTVSVDGDALVAKDGQSTVSTVADLNNFEGTLKAGDVTGKITITGTMKTTAGNDYRGLSLEGISITVYATQLNYESDSTGKDYDKDATYYPVLDAAGLKDALKTGGNISVDANLAPKVAMVAEKDTTLNMNGKTIANTADVWDVEPNSWSLVSARAGATITIDGNGTFKAKENDCYAVDIQDGGKLVIKNGTFIGNIHAVYVYAGEAVIEGGFFSVQQKYPDAAKADEFVLNCYDANRANGTAKIVVKGGTFVNFNPADCQAEGAHTNFVAEGYSVIKETQANGDVWYTVVEGTGVSNNEELNDVISSATEPTTVTLGKGTYTLPSLDNKDITIKGTKDTVIDLSTGAAHHGATIALDGVTVKGQTSGNFEGLQHTEKVIYKNCTIVGKQTLYANDVEFIGCKFSSGTDYALWTYGAKNVTFTECEFESGNNSKSVLCYSVLSNQTFTRTFNKCTFTATGTADKSAIMINPTESGGGTNTYIININDCTATGYAENGIAGQTVVGLRNAGAGVIDTIKVNINGTTVYTH